MSAASSYVLVEQYDSPSVSFAAEDASFLAHLNFQITPELGTFGGQQFYTVNPLQWVGHFKLPSGATVVIRPKIPTANVLRMLAYAFLRWDQPFLRQEEVEYESDSFLFEPLVDLFNDLVEARASRGLAQDYVRHEQNLALMRGRLLFREHIQQNIGYPNRAYCRFFENTVDIPDNQILRNTLKVLLANGSWRRKTEHDLLASLHHFDSVTDIDARSLQLEGRHYHSLNDDYAPIHSLCRLFLKMSSISETAGSIPFKGFLLDMNNLFEKFVEQACLRVGRRVGVDVQPQRSESLSHGDFVPNIQPDITVRSLGSVVAIIDAKYKRDSYGPQNSDLYQVISYGTALRCDQTYLFYPETELGHGRRIPVRNSNIVVNTVRVPVGGEDCVSQCEAVVQQILANMRMHSSPIAV